MTLLISIVGGMVLLAIILICRAFQDYFEIQRLMHEKYLEASGGQRPAVESDSRPATSFPGALASSESEAGGGVDGHAALNDSDTPWRVAISPGLCNEASATHRRGSDSTQAAGIKPGPPASSPFQKLTAGEHNKFPGGRWNAKS